MIGGGVPLAEKPVCGRVESRTRRMVRRQDICNWIVISTCCGHSPHWKIDFEPLDGFKLTKCGWFKA